MTQFFGMRRLRKAEDWQGIAGADNWVPTRSAFELAYAWHGAGGIPAVVRDAIVRSGHAALTDLVLDVAYVEKPVFLDTLIGPSMNDLMGYARNGRGERVVLAVEGKTDETFGLPVASWVKGDRLVPRVEDAVRPTRVRRLAFLSEQLGIQIATDSPLRYQLLHRTTSALLEGALVGAVATLVVIHSFAPEDTTNWDDFVAFLISLGATLTKKGEVIGPLYPADGAGVPLYFLWVTSEPRARAI